MGYIQGPGREQITLFPETLEEYILPENPVRAIDAFVDTLKVGKLGFERALPAKVGRPAYDPKDMIRLYLYGYLNRTRSGRELEKASQRNVEVMWLLRRLHPDFKTILDFRRDNAEALQRVCQQFIFTCHQLGLFGRELVAIDGSKFRADNSSKKSYTQSHVAQIVQQIEGQVKEYLAKLEEADIEEEKRPQMDSAPALQAKIQDLVQNQQYYQTLLSQMQQAGQTQVCLVDADSRVMPNQGRKKPCYNVQTVVDEKHKLIVAHRVTQEVNDKNQLAPMAQEAKKVLDVEHLEVVADKGYYDLDQIQACEEQGITCHVGIPQEHPPQKGLYSYSQFVYDPASDSYTCPAHQRLSFQGQTRAYGHQVRIYKTQSCEGCHLKSLCTKAKQRKICRTDQEALKERLRQRKKEHPEKMRQRSGLSEHPFGTLKRGMHQGYFLTRGLRHVQTEMSLSILAYNLKRVLQIVEVPQLIAALVSLFSPAFPLLQAA